MKISTALFLWLWGLIALIATGWVMNLIDLITATGEPMGLTLARAVGIVIVPLGTLLGYFA